MKKLILTSLILALLVPAVNARRKKEKGPEEERKGGKS
jgi:hypothetical protein